MSNERFEAIIMGVVIGTASGWDGLEMMVIAFYDFEPAEGIDLTATSENGSIQFDFNDGTVVYFDGEGNTTSSQRILKVLEGK